MFAYGGCPVADHRATSDMVSVATSPHDVAVAAGPSHDGGSLLDAIVTLVPAVVSAARYATRGHSGSATYSADAASDSANDTMKVLYASDSSAGLRDPPRVYLIHHAARRQNPHPARPWPRLLPSAPPPVSCAVLKPPWKQLHPKTRAAWRRWLAANHDTAPGVWLVSYRRSTGKPAVPYEDIVEEALCFGWIDSRVVTLDEERSATMMTPRKPRSGWAASNKQRVARLIRDGLMTPAGLAKVEAARRDGSWSSLDRSESLTVPDDLAAAFRPRPKARAFFDAFSPASRKAIIWWVESAKRPETRARRIAETVRLAAQNLKAGFPAGQNAGPKPKR